MIAIKHNAEPGALRATVQGILQQNAAAHPQSSHADRMARLDAKRKRRAERLALKYEDAVRLPPVVRVGAEQQEKTPEDERVRNVTRQTQTASADPAIPPPTTTVRYVGGRRAHDTVE